MNTEKNLFREQEHSLLLKEAISNSETDAEIALTTNNLHELSNGKLFTTNDKNISRITKRK
jgi:DNA-binding Xre family transcriptional regulator